MPPVLNFARISTQGKILLITSLYNSTKIKKNKLSAEIFYALNKALQVFNLFFAFGIL